MNGDRKAELIIFPVEVVEVVSPQVLDISRVDPAMGVGRLLNELAKLIGPISFQRQGLKIRLTIIGGRSSRYQLEGISTRPVDVPGSSGFIQ